MKDQAIAIQSRDYFLNIYQYNLNQKETAPRILIVDDDESSIFSLLSILSEKSAQVTVVKSGELMMKELWRERFDLIFMDRMMPSLRGEVALWLVDGRFPNQKKTPVVFFSDSEEEMVLLPMTQFTIEGVWDKHAPYLTVQTKVDLLLNHVRAESRFGDD